MNKKGWEEKQQRPCMKQQVGREAERALYKAKGVGR
jgi:hypothetical protein